MATLNTMRAHAPAMLAALMNIADTPKHGEVCPDAPSETQTWEEDGGRYAIERLHAIIDEARRAVATIKEG